MSCRVLLVDDHALVRHALRMMLESAPGIAVVGELGDGALVADTVASLAPDVVVMDVTMGEVNGIEATRRLHAAHPGVRVVALSAHAYKQNVMDMLDAGATAYVVKSAPAEQLVQAIRSAAQGQPYLCPASTAMLVASSRGAEAPATGRGVGTRRLGRRETDVLRLLAQGLSSPEIGRRLHIATSTVEVHRRNIMDKLDMHNVVELTKYAIRMGLTEV